MALASLAAVLLAWLLPPAAAVAHALRFSILQRATATGKVTAFDGSSLTIETPGPRTGVVNALIAAAQAVTSQDRPYVWGGGHESAGMASVGIPGPGHNGRTRGFDCSGAVAAVLAGGGLWPRGSGVPSEAGMIDQLRSEGMIAPGVGRGSVRVTLYDDPGVHIFMNINGRFFGTSDGGGGNPSQRRGGAGWLDDGAPDASSSSFKRYHFVGRALSGSMSAGRMLTVELGQVSGPISSFVIGDRVKIAFEQSSTGSMYATAIKLLGTSTVTGTVTTIGGSGGGLTLVPTHGKPVVLSVAAGVLDGQSISAGDTVTVTYTRVKGVRLARVITVVSVPAKPTVPTTPTVTTTPSVPTTPAGATGPVGSGTPVSPGAAGGSTGASSTSASGTDTVNPGGGAAGYGDGSHGYGGWQGYDYGAGGFNGYARDAG